MNLEFSGEIVYWRGPAPWHFVPVPDAESAEIEGVSQFVTYGWGCIPVQARIGDTGWETSLFPKNGRYLVPVKTWVRKAEGLELGDVVDIGLTIQGA